MAQYSREETEEMMRRWIAVNDKAEREGNWRCLADFYTEDVTYGWDTPNGKYEFNDRETVRETCVGAAMDHFGGVFVLGASGHPINAKSGSDALRGFSSEHGPTTHFVLGDGSVRVVSENIDADVLRNLGHRDF